MDHMKKDVSLIKKYTKEALKRVFTTNGVFDEALYQSRVFFISAYHSLNARLGKPSHTFSGDVYVKDVDTGVPEFEYTLRKFLQQQSIEKQQRWLQVNGWLMGVRKKHEWLFEHAASHSNTIAAYKLVINYYYAQVPSELLILDEALIAFRKSHATIESLNI